VLVNSTESKPLRQLFYRLRLTFFELIQVIGLQKFLCNATLGTKEGKKRFGRSRAFRVSSFSNELQKKFAMHQKNVEPIDFPIAKNGIKFLLLMI